MACLIQQSVKLMIADYLKLIGVYGLTYYDIKK